MNLQRITSQRQNLENQLQLLLANSHSRSKDIVYLRGKLINTIKAEIKLETNPNKINLLTSKMNNEIFNHKNQIRIAMSKVKVSNHNIINQASKEVSLKAQKVSTNINEMNNATTNSQKVVAGIKAVGNTLSAAGSVAKVPLCYGLKLTSAALPIVGSLVVQPMQVPGYLFAKLINPDAPYNGQVITKIGKQTGILFAYGTKNLETGIRRM